MTETKLCDPSKKKSAAYFICFSSSYICVFPGMTTTLSRRRVSCRELDHPDCDGWLWKKRRESSVFITQKWQRFWFVLQGPNLYWYNSQQVIKTRVLIHKPERVSHSNVYFLLSKHAQNSDELEIELNRKCCFSRMKRRRVC